MKEEDDQNEFDFNAAPARARSSDPVTSHMAAEAHRGRRAETNEMRVISCLLAKPMTTHEMEELLGVCWGSITPRMKPLCERGLVYNSGAVRPSPYKKQCVVWAVVDPATAKHWLEEKKRLRGV